MIGTRWSIVAAALAVLFAWPAAAAEQAGVTAAVRGQVYLIPVIGKAKHQAKSGEDVFLGDEVSSSEESGMQLMLLDETVFTIGPNTDMTIDEFVYDPATGAGRHGSNVELLFPYRSAVAWSNSGDEVRRSRRAPAIQSLPALAVRAARRATRRGSGVRVPDETRRMIFSARSGLVCQPACTARGRVPHTDLYQ